MIYIENRKIKVVTGSNTQTINVCSTENIHGKYDYIVRLYPPFTSEIILEQKRFRNIQMLLDFLIKECKGSLEKSPSDNFHRTVDCTPHPERRNDLASVPEIHLDSEWLEQAVGSVEKSIDELIYRFIQYPYLHRVEHSIHCDLFNLMTQKQPFQENYPLGNWTTQLVHKEWPEYISRPEKNNRRGNFDIGILYPPDLENSSLRDFRDGRLRPAIVIEMGLDYKYDHLANDYMKLKNSLIHNSYIIHLVRMDVSDDFDAVEKLVVEIPQKSNIKTAYVKFAPGRIIYKTINDNQLRTYSGSIYQA